MVGIPSNCPLICTVPLRCAFLPSHHDGGDGVGGHGDYLHDCFGGHFLARTGKGAGRRRRPGFTCSLPWAFWATCSRSHRDRAVVCFSWVWAVGILLLIFWSTGNMLWQTIFFSLAALAWMAGGLSLLWPGGRCASLLRRHCGFAVLLEGSYGAVWADISGSYALWFIFILFLAADGVLLFRIALKKEWLSVLAASRPCDGSFGDCVYF